MRRQTARRSGTAQAAPASISQQVADRLAPYLGEFNAQVWVKVVAEREISVGQDDLTVEHLATLLEGLRPSLKTFMGRSATEDLIKKIVREVG